MSKFEKIQSFNGPKNSLKLIIDLNKERESFLTVNMTGTSQEIKETQINEKFRKRSAKVRHSIRANTVVKKTPKLDIINDYFNTMIKIHINTVKPYIGHGPGKYIINSVKQMTTTRDFDSFPEVVKKCQNKESLQQCERQKLIKGAADHCGCLPGFVNVVQNTLKVN